MSGVGNNALVQHDGRGGLVPEGEQGAVVLVHEVAIGVVDGHDVVEEFLAGHDLVGDVAGDGDVGEVGGQGDLGAFGVNLEVDLIGEICMLIRDCLVLELMNTYVGVQVGLEQAAAGLEQVNIDVATHDDQLLGQRSELGVAAHSQRNVGQGTSSIDGDLAGILADLLDHEVRGSGRRVGLDGGDTLI